VSSGLAPQDHGHIRKKPIPKPIAPKYPDKSFKPKRGGS
jgi:hypothetical protein